MAQISLSRFTRFTIGIVLLCVAVHLLPAVVGASTGTVSNATISLTENVRLAVAGLEAAHAFFDLMDPDVFARTSVVKFADLAHKTMTSIRPLIRTGDDPKSDMADVRLLRTQFREARAKLDCCQIHILADIEMDAGWKSTYEKHYSTVLIAGQTLENYLTASNYNRLGAKKAFLSIVDESIGSPVSLHYLIVDTRVTFGENLGSMAMRVTRNHRRKVMALLLVMSRVILRGAETNIANEFLRFGERAADKLEVDWHQRMRSLAVRMKEVDAQVRDMWQKQMEEDASYEIGQHRGPASAELAARLYDNLSEKFHWRHWLVLSYKRQSNDKSKPAAMWQCGGMYRDVVLGDFNLVVASSDPRSSLFSQWHAARVLETVQSNGPKTDDTVAWWNHVSPRFGTSCSSIAFLGAVCWGRCEAKWTARRDRLASRKMNGDGNTVNVIVFG